MRVFCLRFNGMSSKERSSSWKKFYSERKHRYKTKFPFLAGEQIAARLKKIWDRKRRNLSRSK